MKKIDEYDLTVTVEILKTIRGRKESSRMVCELLFTRLENSVNNRAQ